MFKLKPAMMMIASVLALLWTSGTAFADYSMPTVEEIFAQDERLAVIDAHVLGFEANGAAHVQVEQTLLGTFAGTHFNDVVYTCFGGSPAMYGVQEGKRYVVFLLGTEMMEETSYFEVVETASGELRVQLREHYAQWLRLDSTDVALDVLYAHLLELDAALAR